MSERLEREPGLINLSDLIIYNPQVNTFEGLLRLVATAAKDGARFITYDVKPDYGDTPKKWQTEIERVFNMGARYLGERP